MTSLLHITRRAADRLRAGHLWVYRSDIEQPDDTLAPGALVTVVDNRKIPLGTALYSTTSQIAGRLVSRTPALSREQYLADLRDRITAALALRRELAPFTSDNNAHRLLFAESDNLPGIIADRYNDLIILQLLTQGTAQDDVRQLLTEIIRERLHPSTIIERPDPKVRELEQLAAPSPAPLYTSNQSSPTLSTIFTINNLRLHYDATSGQKTGAFLDQRLNYAAAASHAKGRALDVCTYQGGFALHMAQRCDQVTGIDASRAALEVADRNLELNSQLKAKVEWIEADAFEFLRDYEAAGENFDTIVLDPPAFAKSKRAAEGALRGYKELNLRAMKMLQPGGNAHHLFLLPSRLARRVHRRSRLSRLRCRTPRPAPRIPGSSPGPPGHPHPARDHLPEMPHLPCNLTQPTTLKTVSSGPKRNENIHPKSTIHTGNVENIGGHQITFSTLIATSSPTIYHARNYKIYRDKS